MQLSLSSDVLDPDGDRRFVIHELGDVNYNKHFLSASTNL